MALERFRTSQRLKLFLNGNPVVLDCQRRLSHRRHSRMGLAREQHFGLSRPPYFRFRRRRRRWDGIANHPNAPTAAAASTSSTSSTATACASAKPGCVYRRPRWSGHGCSTRASTSPTAPAVHAWSRRHRPARAFRSRTASSRSASIERDGLPSTARTAPPLSTATRSDHDVLNSSERRRPPWLVATFFTRNENLGVFCHRLLAFSASLGVRFGSGSTWHLTPRTSPVRQTPVRKLARRCRIGRRTR